MVYVKYSVALTLAALLGVHALPSVPVSPYAVKESHGVPRAWTAVGPADKSETINLQIGLKQSNEGEIERQLLEISDPDHERYGQHLSAKEVADIVRPAADSKAAVHQWLVEHGIQEIGYSPADDWVSIVVPIEKAEELLQTSYTKYTHRDGSTLSRAAEWSLPLHLHEHIDVVQPTTSFFRPAAEIQAWGPEGGSWGPGSRGPASHGFGETHPMSWWEKFGKHKYGGQKIPGANHTAAVAAACNASFVTIDCLRTVYGTIDYTAQAPENNSVAINNYLNETNRRDDTHKFLSLYRPEAAPEAYTFPIEIIADAYNYQGPNITRVVDEGYDLEGNLDAQMVLGISYPTKMTAFSTGGSPPFLPDKNTPTDTNEPYLTFFNYILAQQEVPYVFSSSYGDDEQTVPYSYAKRVCSGFAQLGARGVTYMVSSGDAGVGAKGTCYSNSGNGNYEFLPAFPTSCPWVTSVGATANFNPETAVTRFASGGGFSNYFGAPAYQQDTVNAYIKSLDGEYNGFYNKSGRGYPDVAAQGNHNVIVWAGNITTIGGTSASSPTFAAIIALVNDALLAAGKKPLGFINPWLYSEAYKTFTDITVGSSFGCNTTGFPAQKGWDAVTGWGTPNFPQLVQSAFRKN